MQSDLGFSPCNFAGPVICNQWGEARVITRCHRARKCTGLTRNWWVGVSWQLPKTGWLGAGVTAERSTEMMLPKAGDFFFWARPSKPIAAPCALHCQPVPSSHSMVTHDSVCHSLRILTRVCCKASSRALQSKEMMAEIIAMSQARCWKTHCESSSPPPPPPTPSLMVNCGTWYCSRTSVRKVIFSS